MYYYYLVLNGTKLPTPYPDWHSARAACDELKERIGASIIDIVYE